MHALAFLISLFPLFVAAHGPHGHSGPPTISPLNETEIIRIHGVTPLSYYGFDGGNGGDEYANASRHGVFMTLHVVFLSLAFAVAFPLLIASRKHRILRAISVLSFVICTVLGTISALIYSSLTPNLYKGQKHNVFGWLTLLLSSGLIVSQYLHTTHPKIVATTKNLQNRLLRLVTNLPFMRKHLTTSHTDEDLQYSPVGTFVIGTPEEDIPDVHSFDRPRNPHWWRVQDSRRGSVSSPLAHSQHGSDTTLQDNEERKGRCAFFKKVPGVLWYVGMGLAYVSGMSGLVVYSGGCRGVYLTGCLAHTIKGSIFIVYGLISWARFCGAWKSMGWAWNKPSVKAPSAEMVECFWIFAYGLPNTFMERFGKSSEQPYSVKDIQHISIAGMMWFAGILGMMLESRTFKHYLSGRRSPDERAPPTYSSSYNVFPALAIGVTGLAMSQHHQEYPLQVTIHALWGGLLALFSLFRVLTYAFLFLRPPSSTMPSHPPTEALASFFLACGGIVFVASDEELVYWMMRNGFDDAMAVLNVTVTIVCLVFAWMMGLFALRGYIRMGSPGANLGEFKGVTSYRV